MEISILKKYPLLLLYFFSGVSALIYEIIWARMLGLIVGTAVAAWATVLVAYMGGMALGSFFGGRVADRVKRPLIVFIMCEVGIGLFGLVSPTVLHMMQQVCAWLPVVPGLQIIIAVVALIIPTMLMGATFPLVGRTFLADDRPFGSELGKVYAANTLGAIIGTLTVGFFLLPAIGMAASLLVAAGINFCVALGAMLYVRTIKGYSRGAEAPHRGEHADTEPVRPRWLFPLVLACSGFCAMAFEVLWSRALVFFLTSTTYSFTVVLSVVLAGLAFGGMVATVIARKWRTHLVWIAALQLFIGLYGFASLLLLHHLDPIIYWGAAHMTNVWWQWISVRYIACSVVIFPAALCMGATFPLVIGAACRSVASSGRTLGRLSALNTLGGIGGSIAAAFLLIPTVGIQRSLVVVALVNCFVGLAVLRWGAKVARSRVAGGVIVLLVVSVIFLRYSATHPMVLCVRAARGTDVIVTSYREDQAASVAVLTSPRERRLNIDGFNAAGTHHYEYMHLLAHLPVLLSSTPDTALVICFGSGTTCGTVALYPQVDRVDCAEISPAVIGAAPYFADVNYHAVDNPKVRIMVADGRNHLLRTRRRYDLITLEPMPPYSASATNLYSADFYKLCRSRLSTHGVMAQWAPMHVLSQREYRMLIASFASVFPHTSLWLLGTEAILIGTMDSLQIDIDSLRVRMAPEEPMADLQKISLTDPARLLSCFLMNEQRVREFVGTTPAITDDLPGLEFSALHSRILPISRMWLENMHALLVKRVSVLPNIVKTDDSTTAAINRCQEASSRIMQAGILNALGQFTDAFAAIDTALILMSNDTTARMIWRETARKVLPPLLQEAHSTGNRGNLNAAEQMYLQVLKLDPTCTQAQTELAMVYNALGMFEKTLEYAQKAVASSPGDPAVHTDLGAMYLSLNRFDDAEKELLEAVRLQEATGRAYSFLGTLYRTTGRRAESERALQKALALGYRQE